MNKASFVKHINGTHPGDLSTQRGKVRLLLKYVYDSVDITATFSTFEKFFDYLMGTHEGDLGKQREAMNLVIGYMWENYFFDEDEEEPIPGFPQETLAELIAEITGGAEGDLKYRRERFSKFLEYCWDYHLVTILGNTFGTPQDDYLPKSLIVGGDVTPSLTIEIKNDADFVADDTEVEDAANWTLTLTDTGLTLGTITRDENAVTFAFTGTAVAAKTVSIKPKSDILVDGVLAKEFSFVISSPATLAVKTGSVITEGDEDPTITLVLTNDSFVDSKAVVQLITNWTVNVGGSGLTFATITQTNNEVVVGFTGTANATQAITFIAKKATLVKDRNSNTLSYTTAAA